MVDTVLVPFQWHPGMSAVQKKKNVAELHHSAERSGYFPLLEISSKSDLEVGVKLSAFHQKIRVNGRETTVECAFQGSKVFERGGPYIDLYEKTSREAKKDDRLKGSGRLIGFIFEGEEFPLSPPTAFYDWLYINALYAHRDWLRRLDRMAGFTDIEFNPAKSINCQARSCALFVALSMRDRLDDALQSFGAFLDVTQETFV